MTTTTTGRAATGLATDSRHAVVQGLHDLADWLATHPDVPVNTWQRIAYCVPGDDTAGPAGLAAIAAVAGTEITDRGGPVTADTTHFDVTVRFGPVVYEATYITRDHMADYAALMSYSGTIRADRQEVTA